ncbi:hypothetical protein HW555_013447 [Spodoptera exigua]|uniref:Uncharacterized protein n=1 Tax=Spodoptera exigua TaxID=7107 RepID=A0A835G4Q9_SPOEX|nr:hypothetical protein HW555_013447 [Spodoptera exigua]
MEHTNNNDDQTRMRRSELARGGGGRGMRLRGLRGSMATRNGRRVRTRGGQRGGRPLVSEPVFCGMLENLPEGQPLETALHPKRARVLPPAVAKNPRSETLWSSLDMIAPSTPSTSRGHETPPPMLSHVDMAPSPAQNVGCGASSGSSTPQTTQPVNRGRRYSNTRRPLRDDELSALINYGSEEESD